MSTASQKAARLLQDVAKSSWLPVYHEREIDEICSQTAQISYENIRQCEKAHARATKTSENHGGDALFCLSSSDGAGVSASDAETAAMYGYAAWQEEVFRVGSGSEKCHAMFSRLPKSNRNHLQLPRCIAHRSSGAS